MSMARYHYTRENENGVVLYLESEPAEDAMDEFDDEIAVGFSGNGGTDLPGFPTFRQALGQSRNPPPIGMLKTPSSRETIGRRRGKAGHAAAAR